MKDIRVVHDKVGVYSDWFKTDDVEPWLTKHWHNYIEGKTKPHYQLPVLMDDAFTATNYLFLSLCPENNGPEHMPCLVCLDDFLDGLEGMDRRQAECLTE